MARSVSFASPSIPVVSNITGEPAAEELCSPDYWVRHVRETVRFADGARWLDAQGVGSFLEIGPDGVLSAMTAECLRHSRVAADGDDGDVPAVAPVLKAGRPETFSLVCALAEMWTNGMPVDWAAILRESGGRWVGLPTYPFQRRRYWLESSTTPQRSAGGHKDAAQQQEVASNGFWDAVEREDLVGLLDTLQVDDEEQRLSLGALLPSLSAWRRRSRAHSLISSWRYQVQWRPIVAAAARALSGTWLVVVPAMLVEDRWVSAVIDALEERGVAVVPVRFDEVGDPREALALRLREALDGLPDPGGVEGVISLLALQERCHPVCGSVTEGLAGTAALVQALGDAGVMAPLWLVTRGAVSVAPADVIRSPIQAQAWGLGLVVGLEHPERWGGMIDLPESFDERVGSLLVGMLAGAGGEDQLAVRGAGLFARRVVRSPSGEDPATGTWSSPVGTVLVTGGTGGLGAHVARWLARCGAEHLLLVSRRGADAPGAAELQAERREFGRGGLDRGV